MLENFERPREFDLTVDVIQGGLTENFEGENNLPNRRAKRLLLLHRLLLQLPELYDLLL